MKNWKITAACSLVGLAGAASCTGGVGFGVSDSGSTSSDGGKTGSSPKHDGAVTHDDAGTDATSHVDTGGITPSPDATTTTDAGCNLALGPKEAPCTVSDAYGVFVAPAQYGGSDAGAGTMASPFATIGYAVQHVGSKHLYVCADASYDEQVTVTQNLAMYGGLACPKSAGSTSGVGGVPAWSYTGKLASVSPSASGYALNVQAVTAAAFVDMEFIAQGADTTQPGASSIAVMLNQATTVLLDRVHARSGSGAPGAAGLAPASNWDTADSGLAGSPALATGVGGAGGMATCALQPGATSAGGKGGASAAITTGGGTGFPGTSTPGTVGSAGSDGKGGAGTTGAACNAFADPGANGAARGGGDAGGPGILNGDGWMAQAGTNGVAGDPGQGGGGGGGVLAGGGSGGGAGGCGGAGGPNGNGGGASFAVVVVNGALICQGVTLETTGAGAGGAGGPGERGQPGALGGALSPGCAGAAGGAGAGGSGGGGGAGGPSVGVAVVGVMSTVTIDGKTLTPPVSDLTMPSVFSPGGGGSAGAGGDAGAAAMGGGNAGNPGASGTEGASAAVMKF